MVGIWENGLDESCWESAAARQFAFHFNIKKLLSFIQTASQSNSGWLLLLYLLCCGPHREWQRSMSLSCEWKNKRAKKAAGKRPKDFTEQTQQSQEPPPPSISGLISTSSK